MKNKKIVKLLILTAIVAMTLAFASCAKFNDNGMAFDEEMAYPEDGVLNDSGSSMPSYNEKGEMADNADDSTDESGEFEPKIIKTATLDAETKDFTNAIIEIEASVKTLGGYIESCNVSNRNYSYSGEVVVTRNANYVLRIPADKLDQFLAEAGELLNITSSSSDAKDISGEYYDIQARVSVLETERELVQKMLSEATDIDTMISLESRLYDIIYEIESYKTALKVYDSKVSYSTVNLGVREVADLTDIDADPSFGARLERAVGESWDNTVRLGQELLIGLIYAAPAILVLCVVFLALAIAFVVFVLVLFLIIRGCVKSAIKRRAKRS